MSEKQYAVIGTRPVRHDGADKVTGRALYGADFQATDLLHGCVLRSPHAHARILRIDTSKAMALPGVKAIVTAADFPPGADRTVDLGEGPIPLSYIRGNLLAAGKVLYRGHAVAAVAATNRHIAEEAAGLIEVDYEPLPCVLTAPEAMQDSAPLLRDDLKTKELGKPTDRTSNVADHLRFAMGDIDAGFAAADVVVEREFRTTRATSSRMSPRRCGTMMAASSSGAARRELSSSATSPPAFSISRCRA
jgi:xanthine dehydrogenase molybdenum-binding subunit